MKSKFIVFVPLFVRQPTIMITKILERLEDPKRRLLGPNIRAMTWTGLILPENVFSKVGIIFIHELATCFVITQFVEIYYVRSDIDQVLQNIRESFFSIICVTKANAFIYNQNRWTQVLEYVTETDEYERVNKDEIRGEVIDRYTKYCRGITYFFWGFSTVTLISMFSVPLLIFLSSQSFREGFHNGTENFPHLLSSWVPIDKHHSPGCWITLILHIFMCVYGAAVIVAYDTNIIVVMSFFGGKLDLLRERAKLMLGTPGNRISDEEAEIRTQHLHQEYVLLTKHLRLFNSLLSPIMFLYIAMCSLNICAGAFQVTSASSTTQKVILSVFVLFGLAQLFIYCWQSNDVLVKSNQLMIGPYESEWWNANVKQRKNVFMLAGQFRIKQVFTAGPFTSLTLSTFITIVKGAYSYYTLLRN